jgi:trk/ktr system potassium uptake protein
MNIVICGAGEVGRHAAEVLSADGNSITIIDLDPSKLAMLDESMDVRLLEGNGAHAEVLLEAGCADADLTIAATNKDEINLLAASIAAGVGTHRTIARVHHSAYLEKRGLDYQTHLGIDHLVCPEQTTGVAIAQALRSPGALAVERFARGRIEIQQLPVTDDASAIGVPLASVPLPSSSRLAAIERNGAAFIPEGTTAVQKGDIVTLIGEVDQFESARKLFHTSATRRKRVVMMGGTPMGVWACRALESRDFSVRLVEKDRARAEELAAKLEWVTVLCEDPDSPELFEQERINQADAFVALTDDDEHNILLAARAKSVGTRNTIAVLQRPTYLHLVEHVGIDRAFSPRVTAVTQIQHLIEDSSIRHLASLAVGIADVYEIRVPRQANGVVGKPLKDIRFPARAIIAAIQRGDDVHLPGRDDVIQPGDAVVVIGPTGFDRPLKKTFGIK